MIQANMNVSNAAKPTKETAKKNDKKTPQGAFDQIVNQMAQSNQTQQAGKNEIVQDAKPVFTPITKKTQKDSENAAMENAVQFLLERFPLLPVEQLQGMNAEQLQMLVEQVQTQQVVSLEGLQELMANLQQVQAPEMQMVQQPDMAASKQTQKQEQPVLRFEGLKETGILKEAPDFKAVETQQDTQMQEFELGRSFRDAVQLVKQAQKQNVSGTDTAEEKQFVDVDALQAHVNAQRTQMQNNLKMQQIQAQPEQDGQTVDVSKQIAEKMLLHLEQGEREFSIKLNPDTLGEVTVKLLQKEGKMTLSIAAANESTVKLLNGQLDALKEAVRPMQVEVRQAVVQSQEADGQNMNQQMDMNNGNFFDQSHQAHQQAQQQQNRSGGLVFSLDGEMYEPATVEQAQQAAQTISDNILDLYL